MEYFSVKNSDGMLYQYILFGKRENCHKLLDWHHQLVGCTLEPCVNQNVKRYFLVDKLFESMRFFDEEYQKAIINLYKDKSTFRFALYGYIPFLIYPMENYPSGGGINIDMVRELTSTEVFDARRMLIRPIQRRENTE